MRVPTPRLRHFLLLAAIGLGLSGCVYYPAAPGYYSYGPAYYPSYYGPPVVGSVAIGGRYRYWR